MDLTNENLKKLPSLPERVDNFDCRYNDLTDLVGSPKHVDHCFNCDFNKLTTLKGSPLYVEDVFDCSDNRLTDLVGSPQHVGNFLCDNNQLTSLLGAPKVIKELFSFQGNSNLLDISDIWNSDIGGEIYFDLNKGMAALPLIKFEIWSNEKDTIYAIHERNRGSSKKNILDFQYDLIENGYADNAKWKPE